MLERSWYCLRTTSVCHHFKKNALMLFLCLLIYVCAGGFLFFLLHPFFWKEDLVDTTSHSVEGVMMMAQLSQWIFWVLFSIWSCRRVRAGLAKKRWESEPHLDVNPWNIHDSVQDSQRDMNLVMYRQVQVGLWCNNSKHKYWRSLFAPATHTDVFAWALNKIFSWFQPSLLHGFWRPRECTRCNCDFVLNCVEQVTYDFSQDVDFIGWYIVSCIRGNITLWVFHYSPRIFWLVLAVKRILIGG